MTKIYCLILMLVLVFSTGKIFAFDNDDDFRDIDGPPPHKNMHARDNDEMPNAGKEKFKEKLKKDETKILDYFKTKNPDYYSFLIDVKNKDKNFYKKIMFSCGRKCLMLMQDENMNDELKKNIEKEIELETKANPKIYSYIISKNDAEKENLKKEIISLLAEQFDIRQKIFEQRIEEHNKKIEDLKEDLTERKNNKDKLVQEQFNRLTEMKNGKSKFKINNKW